MATQARRTTRGRQKVEMKKMENENNLQVTFSKRRSGLFKKASELCTLCGAEVAIIVFSPGRKAFSFGHPSLETVVGRFEGHPSNVTQVDAYRNVGLRQLNHELSVKLELLEKEQTKGVELAQAEMAGQAANWWEAPFAEMSLDQMETLYEGLRKTKIQAAAEVDRRIAVAQSANPYFYVGSSSSSAAGPSSNPNFFLGSSSSSAAWPSSNPNFFVGSSSSSAAGPSAGGYQGLVNPDITNAGFNFNATDHVMQAPPPDQQPSTDGYNSNPPMPINSWNPNLGGGFF